MSTYYFIEFYAHKKYCRRICTCLARVCWKNDAIVDAAPAGIERAARVAGALRELLRRWLRLLELVFFGCRPSGRRFRSSSGFEVLREPKHDPSMQSNVHQ